MPINLFKRQGEMTVSSIIRTLVGPSITQRNGLGVKFSLGVGSHQTSTLGVTSIGHISQPDCLLRDCGGHRGGHRGGHHVVHILDRLFNNFAVEPVYVRSREVWKPLNAFLEMSYWK